MIRNDLNNSVEEGLADLHIHTTNSDGVCTAQQVVEKAVEIGLRAISITDHDAIVGVDEAKKAAQPYDLEIIPGIELNCIEDGESVHVLGYFIDTQNTELQQHIQVLQNDRFQRAEKIILKLKNIGIKISLDLVLQKAGPGAIGRPHIAEVLLEDGYVLSFEEAFARFLGYGKPAFVQNYPITPQKGIQLIQSVGGISFLAHPQPNIIVTRLDQYVKNGLDGIEIYHPRFSEAEVCNLYNVAVDRSLLVSGGSDFHNNKKENSCVGQKSVPYQFVTAMKDKIKKLNSI